MPYFVMFFVLFCSLLLWRRCRYKSTDYYKQTHKPLAEVRSDKGTAGEYAAYRKLRRLPGYQRFLCNLYVPADHGETTEIDMLLLCEAGVYVLEIKNYSGWIFGTQYQRLWTQTLSRGRGAEKHSFYNPILQNKGHIKWLKSYLGERNLPVYSFVIFGDGCTLKDVELEDDTHVVRLRRARSAIRRHQREMGRLLTPEEIDDLCSRLYHLTQADEETKKQHIEDVRKKRRRHGGWLRRLLRRLFHRRRCPCCGGKLVIRKSRRGENAGHKFLGCSNYPRCHYTQRL